MTTRPCPCGRHSRRLSRILGRTDDMMIIKGVNIFPMQIDKVLMAMPEVGTNYLVELTQEGVNDTMMVKVEIKQDFFQEELSYPEKPAKTHHQCPQKRAVGYAQGGTGGA